MEVLALLFLGVGIFLVGGITALGWYLVVLGGLWILVIILNHLSGK